MSESLTFIKDRAVKTIAAATEITPAWVWQEMPVKTYQEKLTAIVGDKDAAPEIIGQEEKTEDANQGMLEKRGLWDVDLDQLHRRTMQGVGMARTRYRGEPAKLRQLEPLTTRGNSRTEILSEALDWESAWEKLDPAWAPLPAEYLPGLRRPAKNLPGRPAGRVRRAPKLNGARKPKC